MDIEGEPQVMQEDSESSAGHLETLARIARHLAGNGLVVYRCRYDFFAFGSWAIEAGTSHRRLQLVRDGKERVLRCATARLQNAGAVPEWEEHEVVPLDAVTSPADLDNSVTVLIRKYGAPAASRPASGTGL